MLQVRVQPYPGSGLAQDAEGISVKTEGYRTWSESDIEAFEAAHPVGSRARLALALLFFTAQRRADVVLMGRQHVRKGVLSPTAPGPTFTRCTGSQALLNRAFPRRKRAISFRPRHKGRQLGANAVGRAI